MIGNSTTEGFTLAALTAGNNITITNNAGAIQIDGFSGDYGDLDNAPTIGNATLQILDKDANAVATFTANQDGTGTNYQLNYNQSLSLIHISEPTRPY